MTNTKSLEGKGWLVVITEPSSEAEPQCAPRVTRWLLQLTKAWKSFLLLRPLLRREKQPILYAARDRGGLKSGVFVCLFFAAHYFVVIRITMCFSERSDV